MKVKIIFTLLIVLFLIISAEARAGNTATLQISCTIPLTIGFNDRNTSFAEETKEEKRYDDQTVIVEETVRDGKTVVLKTLVTN